MKKRATNVLEYLEHAFDVYPEKKSYIDENGAYTYRELYNTVRAVGSGLLNAVQPGQPVAVYMDKSIQQIAAFFGVVYAGGCYAPVDMSMPQRRVEMILETLNTDIIIVDDQSKDKISQMNYSGKVFLFSDLAKSVVQEEQLAKLRNNMIDTDPLYIIFTSGSTGVPKGVVLNHSAVIDLTEWLGETFNFDSTTVFGNQTPFYFDASVKEIYSTIRNGATMHLLPTKLFSMPKKLFPYLNAHEINTIAWATSAICLVADDSLFEKESPQFLRTILFAGEAMPVKQLNIWRKHIPNAVYVNLYGPTEAAVDSTYYIVDREFKDTDSLPIGRPCHNMSVLILNGDTPVKDSEIGEICVRGTALANGYYRNWEKTKEVFVQNPIQKAYPELIYRTGDMGYYNERGEIMFAAREDDQIKHRGYRIELGEIETALSSIDGIDRACCLFDKKKDAIICVYKGSADRKGIILELSKLLPKYMWPNSFIKLDVLPFNLNGKIDRVQLKKEYIDAAN